MTHEQLIFGHTWKAIKRAQQGGQLHDHVKIIPGKDYGADPIGNGQFRMVPSGDIVTKEERDNRLSS